MLALAGAGVAAAPALAANARLSPVERDRQSILRWLATITCASTSTKPCVRERLHAARAEHGGGYESVRVTDMAIIQLSTCWWPSTKARPS